MATLGTMITSTTYGTWLRGDARGWLDDGVIMPADPLLELCDYDNLTHPPYRFDKERLLEIGQFMVDSLITRLQMRLLALTVRTWHIHLVMPATVIMVPVVARCAKEAVRYGLKPNQPIWTVKYDKRFCYTWEKLKQRVEYVEQHNLEAGWPRQPWKGLWDWEEYVQFMN